MAKSGKKDETGRTLGASAYAAMAAVEGLKLSRKGRSLVEGAKGATLAQRRAAAKRAFSEAKPRQK